MRQRSIKAKSRANTHDPPRVFSDPRLRHKRSSQTSSTRQVSTQLFPSLSVSRLTGYSASYAKFKYSPDGNLIAGISASRRRIELWDALTGHLLGTCSLPLDRSRLELQSLSFSSDHRRIEAVLANRLLSGSLSYYFLSVNMENGYSVVQNVSHASLAKPARTDGMFDTVVFSPDGKFIAGAVGEPKETQVRSATTGEVLMRLPGPGCCIVVCFSPDSRKLFLAVRIRSSSFFAIVNVENTGSILLKPLLDSPLHSTRSTFRVSPDGKKGAGIIYNEFGDLGLQIWDLETGEKTRGPLLGHIDNVTCCCFSPDSKRVADGSKDGTVIVWDIDTGEIVLGPVQHPHVREVAFSPDGKRVASLGLDFREWDVLTGELTLPHVPTDTAGDPEPFLHGRGRVTSIHWFSNGQQFITSSDQDDYVRFWDAETGNEVSSIHFPGGALTQLSPDETVLTIGSTRFMGSVGQWDVRSGRKLGPALIERRGAARKLEFSADWSLLVALLVSHGRRGSYLHFVDLKNGGQSEDYGLKDALISDVSLSPGGDVFAYFDVIHVCVTQTKEITQKISLRLQADCIPAHLLFSPDGQYLCCDLRPREPVGLDEAVTNPPEFGHGTTVLLDFASGEKLWQAPALGAGILPSHPKSLFSPDGLVILRASPNGQVELLHTTTGDRLWKLQRAEPRLMDPTALAFLSDQTRFVVGTKFGELTVHDVLDKFKQLNILPEPIKYLSRTEGYSNEEEHEVRQFIGPSMDNAPDPDSDVPQRDSTQARETPTRTMPEQPCDGESFLNMPATLSEAARRHYEDLMQPQQEQASQPTLSIQDMQAAGADNVVPADGPFWRQRRASGRPRTARQHRVRGRPARR
ncbi:YVTN repeat-like/Quino protein amine dehydrogenase [Coniophora puteana RWD-64-598 SS2]|uniref:YVTN repeat-like/Quino protein amine dehydrogenase n=1 Tax=Coniophora puteana (strain RWD-64-598) TaxID=741705 RepID=A0A5M3MRE7_CONPW|nr:YVTN repeat-like/Quino protein amine dehydrogenase [Coniophora puteana RWD-64-598 SS2]EIW81121.1 YVTN repeat-like/Quino protein amine dehydrogenase [Coniophora puteana RWD-64-598 SS2]